MAKVHVVNKILGATENKKLSIGIILDLSKAFDTVNHDIIIRKLDQYGIRGIALDWFKIYLCNRKQFVCYNTTISMDQYISCDVPQGSVLGPLLFLIDINDICNTSEIISFCLFADDTSLLYDHNDMNTGIQILNTELVKITAWLSSNKLSVNLLKTNYIIFSSGNREVSQAVPLVLNGIILQQVSSTNFLGMNIDSHLSWSNHVNNLATKI